MTRTVRRTGVRHAARWADVRRHGWIGATQAWRTVGHRPATVGPTTPATELSR